MADKPNIEHNIGWAAGFFEGEGSAYVRKHKYKDRVYPSLALSASQVHREPLDKLQEVLNLGRVCGPYGPYSTTRQAHFQYHVNGEAAKAAATLLLPFLFQKGVQVRAAIAEEKELRNGGK